MLPSTVLQEEAPRGKSEIQDQEPINSVNDVTADYLRVVVGNEFHLLTGVSSSTYEYVGLF